MLLMLMIERDCGLAVWFCLDSAVEVTSKCIYKKSKYSTIFMTFLCKAAYLQLLDR